MTQSEKINRAASMGCSPQNILEVSVENKSNGTFGGKHVHKITITCYALSDIEDFAQATYRHQGRKEKERIEAEILRKVMG